MILRPDLADSILPIQSRISILITLHGWISLRIFGVSELKLYTSISTYVWIFSFNFRHVVGGMIHDEVFDISSKLNWRNSTWAKIYIPSNSRSLIWQNSYLKSLMFWSKSCQVWCLGARILLSFPLISTTWPANANPRNWEIESWGLDRIFLLPLKNSEKNWATILIFSLGWRHQGNLSLIGPWEVMDHR